MNHTMQLVNFIGQLFKADSLGLYIPETFFQHIILKDGKPNLPAIIIMADVLYWYRPIREKDEKTNQILPARKKFAADKLQRNRSYYADYGLTNKQSRDAIDFLCDGGWLTKELRTITTPDGTVLNNRMFVEPALKCAELFTEYERPQPAPPDEYDLDDDEAWPPESEGQTSESEGSDLQVRGVGLTGPRVGLTGPTCTETTTETSNTDNMPLRGAGGAVDEFSQYFPGRTRRTSGASGKGAGKTATAPALTIEAELEMLTQAGRTEGGSETAERAYQLSGWDIANKDIKDALILLLTKSAFTIPDSISERKFWYKVLKEHVDKFYVRNLPRLYEMALQHLYDAETLPSGPHALTKTMEGIKAKYLYEQAQRRGGR